MTQVTKKFWPHDLVAGESINVRPGEEDVSDLLASIPVRGLLQALIGRTREDGVVEIIDGNRRLKALKQLFEEGRYQEEVEVHLRDGISDADAFEISLTASVLHRPLHPVAEFEAFADLADKGKSKEEIAEHFGIPVRAVEQRMALGRLHPDVRKAWIDGKISGEAARAFTLAAPADQAEYLAKAQSWQLHASDIRGAFAKSAVPADRAVALFVGVEAYLAAGGQMVPDLFKENPDFADSGLLERLAQEKLAAEAERVRQQEGWGEVLYGVEASESYRWDRIRKPALPEGEEPARAIEIRERKAAIASRILEIDHATEYGEGEGGDAEISEERAEELWNEQSQLEDEDAALDAELSALFDADRIAWLTLPLDQRAKAVAVVSIVQGGKVAVSRGYLKGQKPKPEPKAHATALAAPAPKAAAAGEESPEPTRLSAVQMDEMALTATRAAAHVVAAEPRLALALFVASAATLGSPVRFRSEGRSEGPGLPWDGLSYEAAKTTTFVDVFKRTLLLSIDELQMHMAKCVAHMLDFTSKAINSNSMATLRPDAAQAVRAALPIVDHRAALVQAFDPAEYFSKAPKQEAIAAIRDCGDDPGKHAKLKKADLGAVATRLATERHWLPEILRGEVFDAVLPAGQEGEDGHEMLSDEPTEPEDTRSAAEAADQIWRDQDQAAALSGKKAHVVICDEFHEQRDAVAELKAPELRARLKAAGVKVPFGATREALLDLVRDLPAQTDEAA